LTSAPEATPPNNQSTRGQFNKKEIGSLKSLTKSVNTLVKEIKEQSLNTVIAQEGTVMQQNQGNQQSTAQVLRAPRH